MRNSNGYGSVVKLSGNRRRPYAVRKTTGWNDKGHPIYLTIGYFQTRQQGMIALAEYNKDPFDIDASKITMAELFEKFLDSSTLKKLSKSSASSLKSAFKHCAEVHKMKYKDIKAYHMQSCVDNCGCSYSVQWAIKNLFNHLDKFALGLDIDVKHYSKLVTAESVPETSKRPFTDDEISTLWESKDQAWMDSILVFMYSGWRISELLNMKCADIDLEAGTMKGGTKTKSGKNRLVPIHSKILPFIQIRIEAGNEYLFSSDTGKRLSSSQYYLIWNALMETHSMNHTPHECRHTFRSRLDSAGANKVSVDKLMGHASSSVGERIYTHKTLDELRTAIELIQ